MAERDPRRIALDILVRVEAGAFLDVLIGEAHEREVLTPPDAGLLVRLAYGVETWRKRLDWTLEDCVDRPLAQLDPPVRAALRLGLLQLVVLDRIPAHAAVDTSVQLVRRQAGRGAAGFVNAVLRRCARARAERPFPPATDDLARHWAVRWSHPEWLVRRWIAELGEERTAAILAADNEPAPTVLRIDRRARTRKQAIEHLATLGVAARATTHAGDAVRIDGPIGPVLGIPWAHAQGEASQLVVDLLAPRAAERILDACAAPGGKSGAIAERLGVAQATATAATLAATQHGAPPHAESPQAAPPHSSAAQRLVAADRTAPGLVRLSRLARAGDWPVDVVRSDLTSPPFASASFDAVLLDAPCSGLGTLRAHPELRWRRTPGDATRLARLQLAMLASAAELVRPAGRLVYSTCTLLREENDEVVEQFLAAHPEWHRADPRASLPASAVSLIGPDLALRTAPDRDELDGFFAIRLERS